MTKLTLQQAVTLLEKSKAVCVDDLLISTTVSELNGEEYNEFLTIDWAEEDYLFEYFFVEGQNREVVVNNNSMFLTNNIGDEVELKLLVEMNLEG